MRKSTLVFVVMLGMVTAGCSSSHPKPPSTTVGSPASAAIGSATPLQSSTTAANNAIVVGFDLLLDSGGFASSQILMLHASALHPIPLPYPALFPILSPNRTRILFSSPRGLGIMTRAGHVQTIVRGTKGCFGGGWLSERTVVASCGDPAGWPPPGNSWHLVAIGADGSSRHVLGGSDPGDVPAVSPRTHEVSFGLNGNVYVRSAAGGKARLLVKNTESVFWSADGRRVVYTTASPSGGKQLMLADATGVVVARLATLAGWNNDLAATFSPDGKTIVFSGTADTTHELWRISTSGGAPKQLTTTHDFGDPARG